ncbi:lipopolysaccharide biosynthesis protein [Bacillus cereus]|uniref:lipopolysaccharide biosynthesis protein n=1 Tax=Bacillus cereus TaxID=1396 RepID=UPI000BF39D38|nr:oligosaccharide flippase family protein [Bacillus cereus]MCB4335829.1 hypothetical protein [Bacillus cereus]PFX71801.1 hypothetical protein COL39_21645 [Bacillus cereus]
MLSKIKNILGTKFGKDIIITIAGQVIVLIVAFGLNKVLSNRLGTAGYGEYSITIKTASVLTYIMLACLGIAIPKYLAYFRKSGDKIQESRYVISALMMMFTISLITIVVLYVLKVPFSKIIFGESGFDGYILPILLYAFTSALATFSYSYYRGLDKFYKYSLSQIAIQLIVLFIALVINKDVITLLYMWSLVNGSYGLLVCIYAVKTYYPKAKITSVKRDLKSSMTELASFCLPRLPGEFVLFAYIVVPLIIINHRLGIEATAYFAVATTINSMINPLFSFVGMVLLPLVSKSIASNQFSQADKKVKALIKIYLVVGVIGIIAVEVFTPLVINILFNSEYQSSVPIVRIMILAVLPNAFYLLLRNPLDAMSKIPYNTINLIISFVVLNILVFLSTNVVAYAISFVAAYGLLSILSFWAWRNCRKQYLKSSEEIASDKISL